MTGFSPGGVGVVIGTFGDASWKERANQAAQSVSQQTIKADELVHVHAKSLSEARNAGVEALSTKWVICLDADDELHPEYIESMLRGEGHVRQPSTLGVVDGVYDDYPVLISPKPNMLIGNHVVIGAMFHRARFLALGGFRELPVLEDWDLWIRFWLDGARFDACPDAIYIVHVNAHSRNGQIDLHNQVYQDIQALYMPEASKRGLL